MKAGLRSQHFRALHAAATTATMPLVRAEQISRYNERVNAVNMSAASRLFYTKKPVPTIQLSTGAK